jgi:hypothetical protein
MRKDVLLACISGLLASWLLACESQSVPPPSPAATFVDDAAALDPPTTPFTEVVGTSPAQSNAPAAAPPDAAVLVTAPAAPTPLPEASVPDDACDGGLSPGQLIIDELMIESVAGTGDDGEWLEVANAAGCAVDLRGLHAECPRGSKVATLDISSDEWLAPGALFVVADSTTPAINHYLPGLVYAWAGHPSDVLRNQGATISLMSGDTVIDSVTYPKLPLSVGASLAFPGDCDAGARDDWTEWQTSQATYFPGFLGTPNGPNDDVQCP